MDPLFTLDGFLRMNEKIMGTTHRSLVFVAKAQFVEAFNQVCEIFVRLPVVSFRSA